MKDKKYRTLVDVVLVLAGALALGMLLSVACGCSAAPFVAFPPADAPPEVGDDAPTETATDDGDDAAVDAGNEAAADASDADADIADAHEAGVDAPAVDSPAEAACTVGQPFGCNGDSNANERVVPPMQFCYCAQGSCGGGQYGPDPTPAACATCETYTCACLQAILTLKSCSEQNGQITVVFP